MHHRWPLGGREFSHKNYLLRIVVYNKSKKKVEIKSAPSRIRIKPILISPSYAESLNLELFSFLFFFLREKLKNIYFTFLQVLCADSVLPQIFLFVWLHLRRRMIYDRDVNQPEIYMKRIYSCSNPFFPIFHFSFFLLSFFFLLFSCTCLLYYIPFTMLCTRWKYILNMIVSVGIDFGVELFLLYSELMTTMPIN